MARKLVGGTRIGSKDFREFTGRREPLAPDEVSFHCSDEEAAMFDAIRSGAARRRRANQRHPECCSCLQPIPVGAEYYSALIAHLATQLCARCGDRAAAAAPGP